MRTNCTKCALWFRLCVMYVSSLGTYSDLGRSRTLAPAARTRARCSINSNSSSNDGMDVPFRVCSKSSRDVWSNLVMMMNSIMASLRMETTKDGEQGLSIVLVAFVQLLPCNVVVCIAQYHGLDEFCSFALQ